MNTIEVRRKGGLPFVISGPLIPRKVLQISYNLANLPESVEGADGASLTYSYLPFGTRIPGSIQAADNRHRFGGKEEQRYGIDAATGSPAIDLGLLTIVIGFICSRILNKVTLCYVFQKRRGKRMGLHFL